MHVLVILYVHMFVMQAITKVHVYMCAQVAGSQTLNTEFLDTGLGVTPLLMG